MEPFELRSERVLLSSPTTADIDRITAICQDPELLRWTTLPSPYARKHAEHFVRAMVPAGWAESKALIWAIREPADATVIGTIGVRLSGDGQAEIGFWLASDARGKGLMSHAVRLVAERVLTDAALRVTHLVWWAIAGNWTSRRVAWATGFRLEGRVRGGLPQRGIRRDAWVGTLLPGEPLTPRTPWLDVPIIHGERVILRPFDESDVDAVVEACSDPLTQHWLTTMPQPYTREDAIEFIENGWDDAAGGRRIHWAATRPSDGMAVGAFAVHLTGAQRECGVIGYWVHPAARRTGVATEAVRLMVRHAFIPIDDGGLGLLRLKVVHADGNDASRAVIERAGFHHLGVERAAHRLRDGTIVDNHVYDLIADDLR